MATNEQILQQFPKDKFESKQFQFSKQEATELAQLVTITTIGNLAKILIDSLINEKAIPRVGLTIKKGMHTMWDQGEGTFTIFTPKFYCELCKENPGEYSYRDKNYCQRCCALVQMKEQVEKEKNATKPIEPDIVSEENKTDGNAN